MTRRAIGVSERPPLLQTIPLSLQHLFAMFGATVLVPVLFHINPATVLLFNGIGTLLYLFICKGKIPGLPRIELCLYFPGTTAVAAGL
ncbi:uracil permease [Salmonella enterica subsp. enterica serovar Madelia]|nr:uracil permease [Salmonella enterica subsp. enterica serovar Madelia]